MSLAAGPGRGGRGHLPDELSLAVEKHVAYIQSLDTRKNELEYHLTEHLRLSGVYWGLTALHILGRPDALPRQGVLDFVLSCVHEDEEKGTAAFGPSPGHDPHILSTGYSIQILAEIDGFAELETRIPDSRKKLARFISSLQQPDGTFAGDEWGEIDTRFLFIACYALSLLGLLPQPAADALEGTPFIDRAAAIAYIKTCQNHDGGFGVSPGAESHSGQIYVCLGALSVLGELDALLRESGKDRLGAWLSERQLSSGGLNGRPMKLVDVCYGWWVLSSLSMIGRLHWIDRTKLINFTLECQDIDEGGIADRPGDMVDVFHTHFGLCGLSLLGHEGLVEVDDVYVRQGDGHFAFLKHVCEETNASASLVPSGLFHVSQYASDGAEDRVRPRRWKCSRWCVGRMAHVHGLGTYFDACHVSAVHADVSFAFFVLILDPSLVPERQQHQPRRRHHNHQRQSLSSVEHSHQDFSIYSVSPHLLSRLVATIRFTPSHQHFLPSRSLWCFTRHSLDCLPFVPSLRLWRCCFHPSFLALSNQLLERCSPDLTACLPASLCPAFHTFNLTQQVSATTSCTAHRYVISKHCRAMAYRGARGLLSQAVAAEIPLHCNICPKKPDFSDVSHLLTHVASKGHLSNYYKMKVKGSSDQTAKRIVDDYDLWYEEWEVQDLMGERMKQKERKKGGHASPSAPRKSTAGQLKNSAGSVSTRHRSVDPTSLSATSARSTPGLGVSPQVFARQGSRLKESVLDPHLDRLIKLESPSRSSTPVFFRAPDPPAMRVPYVPMAHTWSEVQYGSQPIDDGSTVSSESGAFDAVHRPIRRNRHHVSKSIDSLLNDDEQEEMETISDAARLKGVFWQGMACFDSATPDMKRKRNQKKSHSVVEQLMATSEVIEPLEMVFDVTGTLRKERIITGNPDNDDDDSHLSGESSPPPEEPPAKKKKKPVPRVARRVLAERNPNCGRLSNRGNGQLPSYGLSRRSKSSTPYLDVDNDDDLTYGDCKPRKRSGLSIHRDDTGPDITFDTPPNGYTTYVPPTSQASQMRNTVPMADLPDFEFSGLTRPADDSSSHAGSHQSFSMSNHDHPYDHQRVPMYGPTSSFPGTFRPTSTHPSVHSFASFGQVNNHFFHSGNVASHMSFVGQSLGFGPQTIANDLGFPVQSSYQPWDNFFANPSNNLLPSIGEPNAPAVEADATVGLSTESAVPAGIFPEEIQPELPDEPEDDQATVSGPESDQHD
nr:geranylgeranyl transferase type-2 subunit beta [Quercus suber]